jgi:hypothetical protein
MTDEREESVPFHCDWKGKCNKKPYREVYPYDKKDGQPGFGWGWSYLCFWHFQLARIYAKLGFRRTFGWSSADPED